MQLILGTQKISWRNNSLEISKLIHINLKKYIRPVLNPHKVFLMIQSTTYSPCYSGFLENWFTHSYYSILHNIIKTLKAGLLILSSLIHTPPSLMGEEVVKEKQKFSKTHSNIFRGNVTQPAWVLQY